MTGRATPPPGRIIGADLIEVDHDQVTLRTTRCGRCRAAWFPARSQCARCASTDMTDEAAGPAGTVYASSVVRIGPKAFAPPYGLAYVDVGDVRALVHTDAEAIAPGSAVHLQLAPIAHDDEGPLWSYYAHPDRGGAR